MRLLIYGMQSSGASTLAFILAQKPLCGAFVDIWTMYAAPTVAGPEDVVAKVVVTTSFPLSMHQDRFRPDRTILMLRHPVANYRSLVTKSYRHHCGFMEEKFPILEQVFNGQAQYDAVVHYEDLVFDPIGTLATISALGWTCEPDFLDLRRTQADFVAFNQARFPEVTERLQYGPGQHRGGQLKTDFADLDELDAALPVAGWCPGILAHYADLIVERTHEWRQTAPPAA